MNAFEKAKQLGVDLKATAGKAAFDLLPYVSLVEIVKVAMFGAAKYPPGWTWTKPSANWRQVYGSAVARHAMKWLDPTMPDVDIDIDPETGDDLGSGLSHMAHAGFNAMICLWHEARERREAKLNSRVVAWSPSAERGDSYKLLHVKVDGSLIEDERGRSVLFIFPGDSFPRPGREFTLVWRGAEQRIEVKKMTDDCGTVVCRS
jgi:hypothetical protein